MSYRIEWVAGVGLFGAVLLPLIAPAFALIGIALVAAVVVAALAALAGAMLALPYLVVRSLHRLLTEQRRSTERSGPVAGVIARTGTATRQSGVAVLANATTARRSL